MEPPADNLIDRLDSRLLGLAESPRFRRAIAIIIAAMILALAVTTKGQWDLVTYYGKANALRHGADPYNIGASQAYSPKPDMQPMNYLPLTLWIFVPITFLPYPIASGLWLALKAFGLFYLFRLWNRHFLKLQVDTVTALVVFAAFNSPIVGDVVAGQISVFEELLLWGGFLSLLRGNVWLFTLAIVIATQVKGTPILFLSLLLFIPARPRPLLAASGAAVALGIIALNRLIYPGMFRELLAVASRWDERGVGNPSALALIRDVVGIMHEYRLPVPASAPMPIYITVAGLIVAISGAVIWRVRSKIAAAPVTAESDQAEKPGRLGPFGNSQSRLALLFFACVTYGLIVPRFKNYSYMLELIPTLYILRRQPRAATLGLAFVALWPDVFPFSYASIVIAQYRAWMMLLVVWLLYLRELLAVARAESECITARPTAGAAP